MTQKNEKDISESVNPIALKLRMLCETDTGRIRNRHHNKRFAQAMVRLMSAIGITDE